MNEIYFSKQTHKSIINTIGPKINGYSLWSHVDFRSLSYHEPKKKFMLKIKVEEKKHMINNNRTRITILYNR